MVNIFKAGNKWPTQCNGHPFYPKVNIDNNIKQTDNDD